MALKPLTICPLKNLTIFKYIARVPFVSNTNTGHIDEAISTIVDYYIATCSYC